MEPGEFGAKASAYAQSHPYAGKGSESADRFTVFHIYGKAYTEDEEYGKISLAGIPRLEE